MSTFDRFATSRHPRSMLAAVIVLVLSVDWLADLAASLVVQ